MLSVDPPDEDESEDENAQQQKTPRPGGDTPRQTGPGPDGAATKDNLPPDGVGVPGDGAPAERPMMNGDDKVGEVIEIDGEGDSEPSNFEKESPSSVSISSYCIYLIIR